jgi:hypothetical protein
MVDCDDTREAATELRNKSSETTAKIDQHRIASGHSRGVHEAYDTIGGFFARDVADFRFEVVRQSIPLRVFHGVSRLITPLA